MDFNALVSLAFTEFGTPVAETMHIINSFMETLQPRRFIQFGMIKSERGWTITGDTRINERVARAAEFLMRNVYHLIDVFSVRLARGVARLPDCAEATHCTILL